MPETVNQCLQNQPEKIMGRQTSFHMFQLNGGRFAEQIFSISVGYHLTHTIAATSLVGLIAYARLYELASAEMQPLSFHLLFDCYWWEEKKQLGFEKNIPFTSTWLIIILLSIVDFRENKKGRGIVGGCKAFWLNWYFDWIERDCISLL